VPVGVGVGVGSEIEFVPNWFDTYMMAAITTTITTIIAKALIISGLILFINNPQFFLTPKYVTLNLMVCDC